MISESRVDIEIMYLYLKSPYQIRSKLVLKIPVTKYFVVDLLTIFKNIT